MLNITEKLRREEFISMNDKDDGNKQPPVKNPAEYLLPDILERERIQPGVKKTCSSTAGWTSLLVQTWDTPADSEAFEYLPSPSQLISLNLAGERELESFSNGVWRKALTRPGMGGLTAAGKIDRLRWRAKSPGRNRMLFVHIPQFFLDRAAEEFRRAGTRFRRGSLDALSFSDSVIFQTGIALTKALEAGAPNIYAESAAQFLATHLLSLHGEWSSAISTAGDPGSISDRRLRRVMEFMEHHYARNLSLAELAGEAGISRFHFVTLFKRACGATPYQYLTALRMNRAVRLLEDNGLGLKEIAVRCGYHSAANFAAAFQKHFKQTPAAYRKKLTKK